MWRVRPAPVWVQRHGDLRDPRRLQARLYDHLGRELHARAALAETLVVLFREGTHPAVDVGDRGAEPRSSHRGEHRIAPAPVQRRHGPGEHVAAAALEPGSLYEVVSLAQFLDEARDLVEVVRVVGVAHEHEAAPGGRDTAL